MRALIRRILTLVALALPGPAAFAQAPLDEAGAGRVIDQAMQTIAAQYVDAVTVPPLMGRCIFGAEAWFRDKGVALAGPPTDDLGEFLRRTRQVRDPVPYERVVEACLRTALSSLDRLSGYMERAAYQELVAGAGAGVGLEVALEGDYPKVASAVSGTWTASADVQVGDLILAIDGQSMRGKPVADVVRLLRGASGTQARLELLRAGRAQPFEVRLPRQVTRAQSVRARTLGNGVLHVHVAQFSEDTAAQFQSVLQSARAQTGGALAGVILDLRENRGGILESCAPVAAAFLPESAMLVEIRGRNPQAGRKLMARAEDYVVQGAPAMPEPADFRKLPLVVLVNGVSASCAEVIAAALQDHGRAKVVGQRTRGLGTLQSLVPLADGSALRLTTARFYRADGRMLDGIPVEPDVPLDAPRKPTSLGGPEDYALPAAQRVLLNGKL